nr:hypothetical protein [Candidatus Sigynarchaeota archaeon]
RVAVTAYIAAQVASLESASFTSIASALHYISSSLYNAVNRVLGKLGITVTKSLSRVNLAAYFQQPTVLPSGVVKVAPVPVTITKPAPAPIEIPAVSPVQVYAPAIAPVSAPVSKPAPPSIGVMHARIERAPTLFHRPVASKVLLIGELRRRRGCPLKIQENYFVTAVAKAPDLLIVVRRGRSRKVPIPPLPGRLPSPVFAYQGLPGPPVQLAVAPG